MTGRSRIAEKGFSLLETLIATAITLTVTAAVFAALNPSAASFSSELERADMQQRLRVGLDTLTRDLATAGAFTDSVASVLPYRQGLVRADPPGVFRTDRVTVLSEPLTAMQSDTYLLKADPANQQFELMHYDGSANPDVPVLEHVVGLRFDYYGEPKPPTLRGPLTDPTSRTTYGPKPSTSASPPFGPGENCVFFNDGSSTPAPRLAVLGNGSQALVPLTAQVLTDGPWCPDDTNAGRWDADLLRVRKIAVTLRIETASAALRGPASLLFINGGTSRGGARWVPDQEVQFQIAPRNLNRVR